MPLLGVVLSVVIGVSLGLLGGGGSILTVPLLLYVFGLPARQAIATSLLVVGVTSIAALVPHARAGRVSFRTGLTFGLASMAGAFVAGHFSALFPPRLLLVGFGFVMLATALAMLRKRPTEPVRRSSVSLSLVLVRGLFVGAVTGLLGAGGGFLVVPALAMLAGITMPVAVGTSLLVIAMNSFAGLAGQLDSVQVAWWTALPVGLAAVFGAFVGARLVPHVQPSVLRRGFGAFVLVTSLVVLGQQLFR